MSSGQPVSRAFRAVALSSTAFASVAHAQQAEPIDEIVVIGDPLELIELEGSRSIYGLDLSYAEAPRSISAISDETIRRFNIETVDDLAAIAPGAFTGSFFGVPGSVTLRGNRADSYFRGFKRVENPGTFPTSIGASERIEIVRGPTPAIYGAGRVGGFVNVTPQTALTQRRIGERGRLLEVSASAGSYDRKIISGSVGASFDLGGRDAGLYVFGEHEDSKSFYRGIEPLRTVAQAAFTLGGENWDLELGGAYYSSDGYLQTIGWNRVTQALIDDGAYVTGVDTDLSDLNGDGRLTPDEVDAAVGSFFGTSNIRQFIDFGVFPSAAFALDSGVGVATLDPRTVFVSDRDIADSETATAWLDFAVEPAFGGRASFGAFFDSLNGDLYQSYGFAARYVADVVELRGLYEFSASPLGLDAQTTLGASWRRYANKTRQTFLSGYLAVDRRDLTRGATGGDIFDDPFSIEANGIGWDTDLRSTTTDLALFAVSDVKLTDRVALLLSGRLDRFTASSINTGDTIFNPAFGFVRLEGNDFKASFETSLRYRLAEDVHAYATYAENNTLETNDAGGIEVDRIAQGNFVADSGLIELGVKAGGDDLFASLALYRQTRQRQDPFGNLDEETSKGVEAEVKFLVSDAISLNGTFTLQEARIGAPGACGSGNGEFVVLPPSRVGLAPTAGYGGLFAALNASCLSELSGGYERRTTPRVMASGFATYTSPHTSLGQFGATLGVAYVCETGGKIDNAIRLPGYALAKMSASWMTGPITLSAHVDNLFDKRHFIPVQNVYEEVGVMPGRGREFLITLTLSF